MQKQIESMNEIKDTIDDYYDKDLPLIEELSEIKIIIIKWGQAFEKLLQQFHQEEKLHQNLQEDN